MRVYYVDKFDSNVVTTISLHCMIINVVENSLKWSYYYKPPLYDYQCGRE